MLDVRLALAIAVAKPGTRAMFIDTNNKEAGWASSLVAAQRSGRSFCVEVHDDILALDADHAELATLAVQVADDLRRLGYSPVVVRSGGEGRLHLFCLIPDAAIRQGFEARAATPVWCSAIGAHRALDVRKGGKRMRPPLVPHRNGLHSELYDLDARDALAALLPRVAVPKRDVSSEIRERLRVGGDDRSAVIQSFAVAAARAGWSFVEFADEVLSLLNRAGDKFRDRRDCEIELIRSWRKAHDFVAAHTFEVRNESVEQRIDDIRKALQHASWSSRTEKTARRVLTVHLAVVTQLGRLTYALDVRTIAERAGCAAATISVAHELLRHLGWLTRHPRPKTTPGDDTEAQADTWTIEVGARHFDRPVPGCTDPNTPAGPQSLPSGVCRECSVKYTAVDGVHAGHDLWRERGGLGKAKFEVYRLLDLVHPRHAACIAVMLRVGKRIVQRHLAALREHGLAVAHEGCWVRGPADVNDVAKNLGIAGEGARQRARHEGERENYKDYLRRKRDVEEWLSRLETVDLSLSEASPPPIPDEVVDEWAREDRVPQDESLLVGRSR